jgi:fructose-specific phosphotransferase system IIC component
VDIILSGANILLSFMSSSVGYIFILARMVKKTLNRIANWLLGLSDKRIVVISFRIGIIMALVLVVILNRYQSIFKLEDANTAILEFVASAIIIPVAFEWISSSNSNKTSSE